MGPLFFDTPFPDFHSKTANGRPSPVFAGVNWLADAEVRAASCVIHIDTKSGMPLCLQLSQTLSDFTLENHP